MNMKSFLLRTVSGIAILALLCAAFAIGGTFLLIFCMLISLIGLYELHNACVGKDQKILMKYTTYLFTILLYVLVYFASEDIRFLYIILLLSVLVLILTGEYVLRYPVYDFFDISRSLFGFVYISMMLALIYLTRGMNNGEYSIWLIVIGSWGCDTCAYLSGSAFGRHKLAPVLSPKKSVEGAVGGILGSALIALVYAYVISAYFNVDNTCMIAFPIIAAFAALFSQFGDLSASAIKRQFGIKDYGNLIPGHGGILDRFDSMIITAPVIFILGVIFG